MQLYISCLKSLSKYWYFFDNLHNIKFGNYFMTKNNRKKFPYLCFIKNLYFVSLTSVRWNVYVIDKDFIKRKSITIFPQNSTHELIEFSNQTCHIFKLLSLSTPTIGRQFSNALKVSLEIFLKMQYSLFSCLSSN